LMFDTYAHLYVYLIYGMYYCLNVTTEVSGSPGAVLLRKVDLPGADGPGKLCRRFGISSALNGLALGDEVKIFDDGWSGKVFSGRRIGISKDAHLPWRFFIKE